VARISSDYFLRSLALIAEVQDGDMIKAIVFLAVVAANTGHLEQTGQGSRFAGVDSAPPDDVRRPVSALAISQALGMPFETTRRYINRLIADGVLARVKKGVIAPVAVVGSDEVSRVVATNATNVRRFLRDLRRAGITLD
jgi:hypothetical protein